MPKKHLGQHWLKDASICQTIVDCVHLGPKDHVVEIGPGHAALTDLLAARCGRLDAFEVDQDALRWLQTQRRWPEHVHLHHQDALTVNWSDVQQAGPPLRLVANLPYNISTPLLFHVLNHAHAFQDLTLMLQAEVVARMVATPGSSSYNRLSVMLQVRCDVEHLLDVPPSAFHPPPAVDSAVVLCTPRPWKTPVASMPALEALVKAAFQQRRKTLRNNLKTWCSDDQLRAAGLDPQTRPQQVPVEGYVALTNALVEAGVAIP